MPPKIISKKSDTCVIALDPSINTTGYAIRLKGGSRVSGTITTYGNGIADRLFSLREQVICLLEKYQPSRAVVECPPDIIYNRSTNSRTGKPKNIGSVIKLSCATGVVLVSCASFGCITEEVTAIDWKGTDGKAFSLMITGKSDHNEGDACLLLEWYLVGSVTKNLITYQNMEVIENGRTARFARTKARVRIPL